MRPVVFEKDPAFWYETLRSFGHIPYGGADFGEVLATAQRITPGDYESWHDEWRRTAERVAAHGRRSLAGGHRLSARDAFLRAANYYRSAEFFLHGEPSDPRVSAAYRDGVACFREAARLMDPPVRVVAVPYENTELPGYLYRGGAGVRPLVVMHNGFDGTAEEMHYAAAAALAERGYHVLTFDGPGQPGPMHAEGLPFRPDWEHVIGPVLDFALALPDVDTARVALLGNSMGGLLAPRAAAYEPRLAAVIALDGLVDMAAWAADVAHDRDAVRHALLHDRSPDIDARIAEQTTLSSAARWTFAHGMWVMGAATPREFAARMLDYHLADGVAERIACPTLVCAGTDDMLGAEQARALYDRLTCAKTYLEFTGELGADAHCQAGAARLTMAAVGDWLDDTLTTEGHPSA